MGLCCGLKRSPPSAVGCYATGMTSHNRVYKTADAAAAGTGNKYIYAQAPPSADVDALVAKIATLDVDSAISYFASEFGELAVPCNTVREIADLSADGVSKTANFKLKARSWTHAPRTLTNPASSIAVLERPAFEATPSPSIAVLERPAFEATP